MEPPETSVEDYQTAMDLCKSGKEGVCIPVFLRSLFGVDYLPRSPTLPNGAVCIRKETDGTAMIGDDEDILCDAANMDGFSAIGEGFSTKGCESFDALPEEIPQSQMVTPERQPQRVNANDTKQSRKKSGATRKLSKLVKGLKRTVTPSSAQSSKSRSKSVSSISPLNERSSSNCKGCQSLSTVNPKADNNMDSMQLLDKALSQHQTTLQRTQHQSSRLRQQAEHIEQRMQELVDTSDRLRMALRRSMEAYDDHATRLSSTQCAMDAVQWEADDAVLELERALVTFHSNRNPDSPSHSSTSCSDTVRTTSNNDSHSTTGNVHGRLDGVPVQPSSTSTNPTVTPTISTKCIRRTVSERVTSEPEHTAASETEVDLEILDTSDCPVPRPRSRTWPISIDGKHVFNLGQSSILMRVNDLQELEELPRNQSQHDSATIEDIPAESLLSVSSTPSDLSQQVSSLALALSQLSQVGLGIATDEGSRFQPNRDTQKILQSYARHPHQDQNTALFSQRESSWNVQPWHTPREHDILVWTGSVDHDGFGHDWPVVKTRCIVSTTPLQVMNLLLDSTQVSKYNKMSQGREDVVIIQQGVHTTAEESEFGLVGDAKIMRALVKPKMLPKTIEMLSLWHSQPLEGHTGAYLITSRSVWESDATHGVEDTCHVTPTNKDSSKIRSEMLLGVQLLRPVDNGFCELTTISHVFSPGVPEIMAKRFAPSVAANMVRDVQAVFRRDTA